MRHLSLAVAVLALFPACASEHSDGDPLDTPTALADTPANDTNARAVARWETAHDYEGIPTTTVRVSRSRPPTTTAPRRPRVSGDAPTGDVRRVSSTAYCLTGYMASGERVFAGAVAMNNVPLRSRWRVLDGPEAGRTFTVADRIGHSSQFDIAYPGDCARARRYGRHHITVERVG